MSQDSAAKKPKKYQGFIDVKREICKGCGFCVEFCPLECLELEKTYNRKGYHVPFLSKPDLCNGCDMCGLMCPDFAIFGWREMLDKKSAA